MRNAGIGGVGLCVVAGMGCADSAPAQDEPTRGAAHVESTCSPCHPGAQLDAVLRERLGGEDVAALDGFLKSHHVADDALRADVLTYLEARLMRPSSDE